MAGAAPIVYRDDAVLGLSAEWRIRPDHDRALIYKHTLFDLAWQWVKFSTGMILAGMDGRRTLGAWAEEVADLLALAPADARLLVQGAVELSNAAEEPFLVETENGCERKITRVDLERFLQLRDASRTEEARQIGQLQVPLQLLFMPTNRCSTDCVYCYAERRTVPEHQEMTPRRWCELIDEAGGVGIDLIMFSGGDPLLYAGIDAVAQRLADWGMEFLLPTKSHISLRRAEQLAEICNGCGKLQVSIDGVTPAIVDEMLARPGACDRLWATIENLIAAGVRMRTQTVVTPRNLPDVPALVRRLFRAGVREATVTNYDRSFYRHDDRLFLSPEQMDWLTESVAAARTELGWPELVCNAGVNDPTALPEEERRSAWANRAGCSGGRSSMAITPDGAVVLCEQVPQCDPFIVGNVAEQSLMQVWRSPAVAQFVVPPRERFRGTACETCDEFDDCHRTFGRCFRDALFLYRNLYHPPPLCPRAPRGPRMG